MWSFGYMLKQSNQICYINMQYFPKINPSQAQLTSVWYVCVIWNVGVIYIRAVLCCTHVKFGWVVYHLIIEELVLNVRVNYIWVKHRCYVPLLWVEVCYCIFSPQIIPYILLVFFSSCICALILHMCLCVTEMEKMSEWLFWSLWE